MLIGFIDILIICFTEEEIVQMEMPVVHMEKEQTYPGYQYDGMQHMSAEDYDDLMPDPLQFVSMMGAPPPPPMVPPPQQIMIDKNEPVLPPGKYMKTRILMSLL